MVMIWRANLEPRVGGRDHMSPNHGIHSRIASITGTDNRLRLACWKCRRSGRKRCRAAALSVSRDNATRARPVADSGGRGASAGGEGRAGRHRPSFVYEWSRRRWWRHYGWNASRPDCRARCLRIRAVPPGEMVESEHRCRPANSCRDRRRNGNPIATARRGCTRALI